MFAIASALTVRPAVKVTARKAVKVSAFYDPDQYDHDANSGRGSGFVATKARPAKTASVSYASKPARVTRGADGVVYDPDQFDADANVRSNAVAFTKPAGGAMRAPAASHASVGAKPSRVVRAKDGVIYDPDQHDPNP